MKTPTIHIQVLDAQLEMTTRPVVFVKHETLIMTADPDAIDYYGEFRGGTPYIAPELEKWAEEQGGYWEWENPEAISFTK